MFLTNRSYLQKEFCHMSSIEMYQPTGKFGLPVNFTGQCADTLLAQAASKVMEAPELEIRGMKVRELNNVNFLLNQPQWSIIFNPYRKISLKYLMAEWLWYVSGRQDKEGADFIAHYASFWNSIRNEDGSLNSNYGYYVFNPMDEVLPTEEEFKPISDYYFQHSQFDYVIDTLTKDKYSRQAVININNVYHKAHPTKDFPCTLALQFYIREYMGIPKLCMAVSMRSTDLILGFCNDIFQFSMFQAMLYHELQKVYPDLWLGYLTLSTNSLHVYERHYAMTDKIAMAAVEKPELYFDEETRLNVTHIFDFEYSEFKSLLNKEELTWRTNNLKDNIKTIFGIDLNEVN